MFFARGKRLRSRRGARHRIDLTGDECQGRSKSGPFAPVEKWTTLGLGEPVG
jgi:hypothetical protein